MKVLVIGQVEGGAFCWDTELSLRWRQEGHYKNLNAMLALGAFKEGHSRRMLEKLGVPLDYCINLFQPRASTAQLLNTAVTKAHSVDIAEALIPQFLDAGFDRIITCGIIVTQAFVKRRLNDTRHLRCRTYKRRYKNRYYYQLVLPHPSGRARFWNTLTNTMLATQAVERFLDLDPIQ